MKNSLLITILLLVPVFSFGQDTNSLVKKNRWETYFDSLTKEKTGKPFIIDSVLKTIDNKSIQLTNLKHKTMVCFGMYGCHPCAHELPAIVSLAKKTANVDFIYITYNDVETIRTEFEEVLGKHYQLPNNYYIVVMDEHTMNRNNVQLGYPTKYYLDKNGIVLYFQYGGVSLKSSFEEMIQKNRDIIIKYQ